MEPEEHQYKPITGRAKSARRTWLWTHLFFGVLFIVVAALIYQKSSRTVLALIFGIAGLVELVNVVANPFRTPKK